jgi:thymidylate synthase (FAD)
MSVRFCASLGNDLTVVNAARVSFEKESDWYAELEGEKILSFRDEKLINFLAEHNHWTPFGHCQVTFNIKAPIFVARQLGKHQVGMVWNEVSRRYIDSEPEVALPTQWRAAVKDKKQGSSEEEIVDLSDGLALYTLFDDTYGAISSIEDLMMIVVGTYNDMIAAGVCPEQARMILPQAMITEWYWTGSLAAYARICKLRLDSHTQRETRDVAEQIAEHMAKLFPVSWKALMK